MIRDVVKLFENGSVGRTGTVMFFPWTFTGTLKRVRLIAYSGGFLGTWRFDVVSDGVYLFGGSNLLLTPSDRDDQKPGLNIAVVEGKEARLVLRSKGGAGQINGPIVLICEVDDGVTADGVATPGVTTNGFIPQWVGTDGDELGTGLQLDTDDTLAADSDTRIASQKAVKAYVDDEIASIPGGGSGDVVGPAGGVVDGEIVVYDGVTGKAIEGSGSLLSTVLSSIAAKAVGAGTVVTDRIVLFSSTTGLAIKQSAFGEALLTALDAFKTAFAGGSQYQVFRKTSGTDFAGAWGYPVEHITIAVSDETTDLATGTGKVTFRMPYAFFLQDVRINVNTAPTGAGIVCDLNEAGATVFSTNPGIDASEKTSVTGTAAVISDPNLADDAEMTIDVDSIGSTIKGKGLKMTLIGYRK